MSLPRVIAAGIAMAALGLAAPTLAETIHVYEGQSIQEAIDAAATNDDVLIHPGVYNEVIDLHGKQILLHSSNGPEVTIVSGVDLVGSVMTCQSGETGDTVIEGLTIQDGNGGTVVGTDGLGGGLYIADSSPTLRNCIIRNNTADGPMSGKGGGAYFLRSSSVVSDCVFNGNVAYGSHSDGAANGGGAMILDCDMTFTDCRFEANSNSHAYDTIFVNGAGVFTEGSTLNLTRCLFLTNRVTVGRRGDGAGIYSSGAESVLTLSECRFDANHALWGGGLTAHDGAITTIEDCEFLNHSLIGSGGGIHLDEAGETTIARSTFSNNSGTSGAAIANNRSTYTLEDCEFIDNRVDRDGGAIHNWYGEGAITRCLFSGNTAYSPISAGGAMYNIYFDGTIVDSIFTANQSGNWGGAVYNHEWCNLVFSNCLFTKNQAVNYAGAMENDTCHVDVVNSTFSRNSAGLNGQAIYSHVAANTLSNSIFWDNNGEYGIAHEGGTVFIRYCVTGRNGEGNIIDDPLFVDPDNGDFRLSPGSPCIDAGSNEYLQPNMYFDLDGNPRCADDPNTPDTGSGPPPLVDMGAYEFAVDTFTLCEPYPGRAGEQNAFVVTNADPRRRVYFAYGLRAGLTTVPGCPGVAVEIAGAQVGGSAVSDENGRAELLGTIPGNATGRTLYFQAVQRSGCAVSNRVDWLFQ